MLTRLFYIVLLILIATDGWGQLESTAAICGATQQIETPRTADMFNHNGAGHSGSITVNPANTESNSLFNILDTSLWPARWDCGVWSPEHGWLYIISDLSIWLAYFAIPFILAFFYYRRKREIPYKTVFILFIGFIIACGLTHLIDAIIFWWPAYKLSAMLRLGTALVSWGTVFGLVKIIPKALELKGPESLQKIIDAKTDELKQINTALNEEVTKRKKAEQRLEKLNASLEDTVNQRTTELESINKELNAFSYSVSHDLRSPLRSISGFSQALKED